MGHQRSGKLVNVFGTPTHRALNIKANMMESSPKLFLLPGRYRYLMAMLDKATGALI